MRTSTNLFDTSDANAANDRRVDLVPAEVVQRRFRAPNLAVEYLWQQVRHVRMHHRREQVLVQRWVAEPLLQLVVQVVRALRVDSRLPEFFICRDVVLERREERPCYVNLEAQYGEHRRDSCYPLEGAELELETDRYGRRVTLLDRTMETRATY